MSKSIELLHELPFVPHGVKLHFVPEEEDHVKEGEIPIHYGRRGFVGPIILQPRTGSNFTLAERIIDSTLTRKRFPIRLDLDYAQETPFIPFRDIQSETLEGWHSLVNAAGKLIENKYRIEEGDITLWSERSGLAGFGEFAGVKWEKGRVRVISEANYFREVQATEQKQRLMAYKQRYSED